ncbi:MAG: hypothetical protein K6E18_05830 [Lachnospiraceae bacterium]|nr:hypothetical protein [Lachnospiraceae bacterium]
MTLLITVFAAIIATMIWYVSENARRLQIGTLVLMYWGASLMWMCDAIMEYSELHADYFVPTGADMINDAFLGFAVAALGLGIWLVVVLVKDPDGVVRRQLFKKA